MSDIWVMPRNPADLASTLAEQVPLPTVDDFEILPEEKTMLVGLDNFADELGFIGKKYLVESHRSLSIPVSFDADDKVSFLNFMGLMFEGEFVSYSKVRIGRIIGAHSVRALCLTFNAVTLLPYFDGIPEDHLLHVPVLAVSTMESYAA